MKINVFDNDWQAVPLLENKPTIEITEEQLEELQCGTLVIKNGVLVDNKEALNTQRRIKELKDKLASTDYLAIKFAEGALTATEYAPYKAQRAKWRAEINDLEASL